MRYALAVFDLAGTTVADPGFVTQAFVEAMAAAGHAIDPAVVQPLMGYRKPDAIQQLLGDAANRESVARIHGDFVQRMLACYRHHPGVTALPGANEVFAHLRAQGVAVALNTGFSRDIAEAIVERLGWNARIDAVIGSDEVAAGRPAPDMIRALMRQLQVADARQVVKIGDTGVDIEEGRNAGVGKVVAVTTGGCSRQVLQRYAPDQIIGHLHALPPLLGLPPLQAAAPSASHPVAL